MPTQDEVFADIISAVEAGAKSEDKELEKEARDAIRARYFDWIVQPGKNRAGEPVEKTPQEVWDGPEGAELKKRFEEIGQRAAKAAGDGKVDDARADGAALGVQGENDCPWCRQA